MKSNRRSIFTEKTIWHSVHSENSCRYCISCSPSPSSTHTHTHTHTHTRIRRNTWICIRSACPQKYVDLVRVEVQEELRIRRAMKYWRRSRRAEHLAGEGGKIYVSTRCSLHITRRWWRSSLWSASSGGEQTDSKAQNPSEHRLQADPDWRWWQKVCYREEYG